MPPPPLWDSLDHEVRTMIDCLLQRLDRSKKVRYVYCQSRQQSEAIRMAEYLLEHARSFGWHCRENYDEPEAIDNGWRVRVIVYQ